jgi:translation initiation factor 1 (eIF-1/SUI1)
MQKHIDLKQNVYELTEAYPELIEVLKEMGFLGIANPITRKTLGKVITIPQGCKRQGKDLNDVTKKLKELGFEVKS